MHFSKIILLILFAFAHEVSAQVPPSAISKLSYPEQCRVADSLYNYTREYQNEIEVFTPYIQTARKAGDDRLVAMLRLLKPHISENSGAETKDIITDIIYKSKRKGWKEIEAIAYYKFGLFFTRALNDPEKGLKYMLMSYQLYKDWDMQRFPFKPEFLFRVGASYRHFNDFDNAIIFFRKAYLISDADHKVNLNTIGLTFFANEELDSALHYYDLAYKQAEHAKNIVFNQDIIIGNSLAVYLKRGQYDTALSIGKEILERMLARPRSFRLKANSFMFIGYVYTLKGDMQQAEPYLKDALKYYRQIDGWPYKNLYHAEQIYRELSNVQASLGSYRSAYLYADTARVMKDSLHKKKDISKVKNIEKEITKAQLLSSEEDLRYQKKAAIQTRNLLIVIVIGSSIIIILLVYIFSIRQKKLRTEKNIANSEAESLKEQLEKFTSNIQEKNRLLENLEQKLDNYKYTEDVGQYQSTVAELRAATILTDEEWEHFRNAFENVHTGYLTRLHDKYPALTPSETRYFVLAKLDMNTKEMASVLGISTNSVRSLKSRVIKKLELSDSEDISELIHSV